MTARDEPPRNVLVIMMDELAVEGIGCYGGVALTPNIDRLAATGTRFSRAYTPSPICVPARAAFQSGQYVFQNRCWSNAQPYSGEPLGWAHRLKHEGHETVSIGKLHYRASTDDNGYAREIMPLHVHDGRGWIHGLLRRADHTCYDASGYARDVGPGDDGYTDYDRQVRDRTVMWLRDEGVTKRDKPWALFVSFLRPHYPLACPAEWLSMYDPARLPAIRRANRRTEYRHPVVNAFRAYNDYDDHFADDDHRQLARACYFGLCSFVDDLVGDVLRALEDTGASENTTVILTSDHGDMNGHHGFWTKMTMHEGSTSIPMILSGPGVPVGESQTQASLIDVHPTALHAAGLGMSSADRALFGQSLIDLAVAVDDPSRVVFSEYHDGGSVTGYMMIRDPRWKYIAYADGFAPQLFDLVDDPHEMNDLGLSAGHAPIREALHHRMCTEFGDPQQISDAAFADQAIRIEALGGIDGIRRSDNYDHTPVEGAEF